MRSPKSIQPDTMIFQCLTRTVILKLRKRRGPRPPLSGMHALQHFLAEQSKHCSDFTLSFCPASKSEGKSSCLPIEVIASITEALHRCCF